MSQRNPFEDESGLFFLLESKEELEAVFNAISCARHDESFKRAEKIKETMRQIQLDMCEALGEDPKDYL